MTGEKNRVFRTYVLASADRGEKNFWRSGRRGHECGTLRTRRPQSHEKQSKGLSRVGCHQEISGEEEETSRRISGPLPGCGDEELALSGQETRFGKMPEAEMNSFRKFVEGCIY